MDQSFPTKYGNIFQKYGNITEVVIPTKKDKGGKRFGFAYFDDVKDIRSFGSYLDTIIIGKDKISVNLSRFQKESRGNRFKQHVEEKLRNKQPKDNRSYSRSNQIIPRHREEEFKSFAHVIRKGGVQMQNGGKAQPILLYEAEKEDMKRLKKAFVGEVMQAGMTHNLKNEFHMQGYFGGKITPLGANLALLEGQDQGEVSALLDEVADRMKQWF